MKTIIQSISAYILVIASGLFSSTSLANNSITTVQLPLSQTQLQYSNKVRLDQVLTDAFKQQQTFHQQNAKNSASRYPIGFKFFSLDKQAQIDTLYNHTLNTLKELAKDPEYAQPAGLLIHQLSSLSFAYRENITLDYDQVRLDKSLNPMLQGHYRLELTHRPSQVHVFGLINSIAHIDFDARKNIQTLLNQTSPIHQHSHSFVWLIYPDGVIKKTGYGLWNNQHASLIPGTMILLGFESQSDKLQRLEFDIATLLSNTKGTL